MITLFRKIRQKLIDSGSITKYMLYALGEILLVVIGILIALQINNWNETKKERATEIQLLTEVVSNMDTDLKNLEESINDNTQFLNSNLAVLNHLKGKGPMTDSLRYSYSWIYGHGNFQPNMIGFENLRSIGIDIIKDDSVRMAISELYSFKYYRIVEDRRNVVNTFHETLTDELLGKRRVIDSYNSAEPINIKELRSDIRFQNAIATNIFILEWTERRYRTGLIEIKEVRQKIFDYLDQ